MRIKGPATRRTGNREGDGLALWYEHLLQFNVMAAAATESGREPGIENPTTRCGQITKAHLGQTVGLDYPLAVFIDDMEVEAQNRCMLAAAVERRAPAKPIASFGPHGLAGEKSATGENTIHVRHEFAAGLIGEPRRSIAGADADAAHQPTEPSKRERISRMRSCSGKSSSKPPQLFGIAIAKTPARFIASTTREVNRRWRSISSASSQINDPISSATRRTSLMVSSVFIDGLFEIPIGGA